MDRSEENTLKVFNKTSSQNTFLFPFGCTELFVFLRVIRHIMSVTLQIKSHIVVRMLQKEETEKAFHKFESVVLGEKALHCSIIQNDQIALKVV